MGLNYLSPRRAQQRIYGIPKIFPAPVVQKVDNAIHWINFYPLDSTIGFPNTYLRDSDLSVGSRFLTFEQLGPGVQSFISWHKPARMRNILNEQ